MKKNVILCVDDERIIIDSLLVQLERNLGRGYIYEAAENTDEAMELIEEYDSEGVNIVIIVSDWLMPGKKGDEFLIDVHKRFPGIVKIMLTGQADEEAIERVKKYADLHKCISKPWSEDELIKAIQTGIQKIDL